MIAAVGPAVGRGVARVGCGVVRVVPPARSVADGPAVAVGPAVAAPATVGAGLAVVVAVAKVAISAEPVESVPAPLLARPIAGLPEVPGVPVALPVTGPNWTKATASTAMPTRAAAKTGRAGFRMGSMLRVRGSI